MEKALHFRGASSAAGGAKNRIAVYLRTPYLSLNTGEKKKIMSLSEEDVQNQNKTCGAPILFIFLRRGRPRRRFH